MTPPSNNFATLSTFCSNPNCNEPFDLNKARAEIEKIGIVYADCGDVIYQGYKCTNPDCSELRFVSSDRNNPVFDLRNFIITPNQNLDANVFEQLMLIKDADKIHEFLKFKFIPAWDEENVSIQNFRGEYNREMYDRWSVSERHWKIYRARKGKCWSLNQQSKNILCRIFQNEKAVCGAVNSPSGYW